MPHHRLAAIMFSDIVGYTSLMGSNEKKAFEVLKNNRRIHRRLIKKYRGKWLKEMGDGILASFSSNIDAVMCAVFIQKASIELEIPLRIGIHQGDVIFEQSDILGDGVNVASRIQGLAEKSGIAVSETVHNEIKNKEGLESEFLGEQLLKGLESPIGIYKISCHNFELLDYSIDTGELIRPLQLSKKTILATVFFIALLAYGLFYTITNKIGFAKTNIESIVILPLDNFTGADTLEYYVAGIHDALIRDLGKLSALRVTSKTSSRAFQGSNKTLSEIGAELNADAALEGSVSCFDEENVCLNIQLISTLPGEKQLWAQEYYIHKSQILNLYHKVTKQISEEINIILTPMEEALLAETRDVDPEAYDAYLKGQYYWEKLDGESMQKAREYFKLAIDLEPEWADPYAGLANAWGMLGVSWIRAGFTRAEVLAKKYNYLNKALELNPNSAQAHYVKAITSVWTEWDWEQGEREFLRTLELNPNDALCRLYYAHLLIILQRPEEAIEQVNLGLELDPRRLLVLGLAGMVMSHMGDYQSAILHLEKALSIDPNHRWAANVLSNVHLEIAFMNGDFEKWFEIWDKKVEGNWNDEGREAVLNAFHKKGHIAGIEEMFKMNEKYGDEGCLMTENLKAQRSMYLKNYDKAMEHLEKAIEMHAISAAYMGTKTIFNQFKDHPRYIELLKKMNLPLE